MTRLLLAALTLSLLAAPAWAECIQNPELEVVDGDTVEWLPTEVLEEPLNVRLLGFDTPETSRPECPDERALGEQATERLEELLESHEAILCITGTMCGHNRPCGVLVVQQGGFTLNVGSILMAEGLARPFTGQMGEWCE